MGEFLSWGCRQTLAHRMAVVGREAMATLVGGMGGVTKLSFVVFILTRNTEPVSCLCVTKRVCGQRLTEPSSLSTENESSM